MSKKSTEAEMEIEISEQDQKEKRSKGIRFRVYWILSVFSTLEFLASTYAAAMDQYPLGQFPPIVGLWMCSISGVLSGTSLVFGLWKFRTSEAPVMVWPLGPLLSIPIALVFGLSLIGFLQSLVAVAH
jgi:hypothetical protein